MTVKELIKLLEKQPQDHEVLITSGKYGSPCNIVGAELGEWDGSSSNEGYIPDHCMEDEETNCVRLIDNYSN